MHGDARDIVPAALDLSGVQSDPGVQAELTHSVQDRRHTLHGPSGPVESGKDSVAGPLHEMAAESSELSIDGRIVLFEALSPGAIPERRRLLGRTHDVGEQDCGQEAIAGRHLAGACQELLDFPGEVCIACPRNVIGGVDLNVASARNIRGEKP